MHPLDVAPFAERFAAGLGAGALTWIAAIAFGTAVVRRLAPQASAMLVAAVGAALGYGAAGSAVAVLGLFHAIGTSQCIGALVVLTLAGTIIHGRDGTKLARGVVSGTISGALSGTLAGPTTFILIASGATMAVMAALPTVWWDPLAYHLPLVAAALHDGFLRFDPSLTQSGFPQLAEMASVPAYALAGTAGAQFASLGCALVLALLVGVIAQAYEAGTLLLAATLVASSSLVLWLGPSAYVDVAFAMFVIGGIALPMSWRGFTGIGPAIAAGALAGCAAAVKYPGAVDAFVVCVAVAVSWRSLTRAAVTLGTAAVVAGGWYARNALTTGDPAYPFLSALGLVNPAIHEFAARYVGMTQNWCGGPPSLQGALSLPLDLVLDPLRYCGDPGYALRFGVVIVAFAWLWRRDLAPPYQILIALLVLWYASSRQLRFFVPALALVALITTLGAVRASDRLRPIVVGVLAALCAIEVAIQWLPQTQKIASAAIAPAFAYVARSQSADDYLSSRLEFYDAARWLRVHDPGAAVGSETEVRLYYFGRRAVDLNPYYQPVPAIGWALPDQASPLRHAPANRYLLVNANRAYLRRTPVGMLIVDDARIHRRPVFEAHDVSLSEFAR